MNLHLTGKRVLITAGAVGIGRVIAEGFAAEGARVHVCDIDAAALASLLRAAGSADATESVTRNPLAAFDHRQGFRLGAPIGFKDYMWEALADPAAAVSMIQTAENLAKKYGITREAIENPLAA